MRSNKTSAPRLLSLASPGLSLSTQSRTTDLCQILPQNKLFSAGSYNTEAAQPAQQIASVTRKLDVRLAHSPPGRCWTRQRSNWFLHHLTKETTTLPRLAQQQPTASPAPIKQRAKNTSLPPKTGNIKLGIS